MNLMVFHSIGTLAALKISTTLYEISGPIPLPGKRTTFLLADSAKKNFDWYLNRAFDMVEAASIGNDSIKKLKKII